MRKVLIFATLLVIAGAQATAESLVAARTIRSQTILTAADLIVLPDGTPGALDSIDAIIGLETLRVLYQGQPVRQADLGPAAQVERNQIVTLIYRSGGLRISAEGRTLARGAVGDHIRVMNLGSRKTVSGRVTPNGSVQINAAQSQF